MYQIAQNFTLRLTLSFTVCVSLLLVPGVSLLSEASLRRTDGAIFGIGNFGNTVRR